MKRIIPTFGFSTEFSLTDVSRLRVMAIFAALIYPVWGVLFHYLDSGFVDAFSSRLIVSSCFIIALLTSFNKKLSPYFGVLFIVSIWILTAHYFNLIIINTGHYLYVSGAYLVIMVVTPVLPSKRTIYSFYAYVMAYSIYIVTTTLGFKTDPRFFLLGVLTCLTVGLISQTTLLKIVNKLRDDEVLKNKMLSNLVEGIVLRAADGSIISANAAASKIFGRSHEQLFTEAGVRSEWQAIREDGSPFIESELPSVVAMRERTPKRDVTMGMKSTSGDIFWIRINAIPLTHQGEEQPYAVLLSYHDITEQKQSEKKLIEQQALIANSARISSLGVMASGIAHEINNPLAIIAGRNAQLMRMIEEKSLKPEALWPIVKNIEHTVQRISKIIHGLKAFSRDGHADPFVVTAVQQVIDDAVVVMKEVLSRRGIELRFDIASDLIFDVRSVQITQVLVNLMQNAADAIENLQTEKWIKISAWNDGDANYTCIAVEDSGNGIPKEIQDRIMEPFFTTKQVGKGTGLGLSISSGIINSHNGSLYIDVDVKNTKFVISLPKSQKRASEAS